MRINKYIALATGISRRSADDAIQQGRVKVNGQLVQSGLSLEEGDTVTLDGQLVEPRQEHTTIMLNKPPGYVVSRDGQGSLTIYDLLPQELYRLKPIGRLDKDSSGLLLLTDDGQLANHLTHPRYQKTKVYEILLNKPLQADDLQMITQKGVKLDDGPSRFELKPASHGQELTAILTEGRNRQIRRTFEALGYKVARLHRTKFGDYELPDGLKPGEFSSRQAD